MQPHGKLYLSAKNGKGLFGDGKYQLLKAIQEHGSIQVAAQKLGRSYRKAWGDIRSSEKEFGRALVIKTRGGKCGGSTVLTDFGSVFIKKWEKYKSAVESCMAKSFDKFLKQLVSK